MVPFISVAPTIVAPRKLPAIIIDTLNEFTSHAMCEEIDVRPHGTEVQLCDIFYFYLQLDVSDQQRTDPISEFN